MINKILLGLLLSLSLACFGQTGTFSTLNLTGSAPPPVSSVSASVVGSGGTATYFYWVIAVYPSGNSVPFGPSRVNNAASTFSASNYVRVNWSGISGITSYTLLRTTTQTLPSTGNTLVASGLTSTAYNNTSSAVSSYTVTSGASATAQFRLNNTSESAPYINLALIKGSSTTYRVTPFTGSFVTGNCVNIVTGGLLQDSGIACTGGGGGGVTSALALTLDQPVFGDGLFTIKVGTKTGTGTVAVMQASPSITTPTIADFTNSNHDHEDAAGGGQVDTDAVAAGNKTGTGLKFATGTGVYTNGNCVSINAAGDLIDFGGPCSSGTGVAYPNWTSYTVLAIANGVNGCANANGCWQVNGVLGANKTAGLTQDLTLFQLPASGSVTSYRIKTAVACTGTTTLATGLGTASSPTFYLNSTYDLKAAVTNTNVSPSLPVNMGSDTAAAVNIVASMVATVDNIDQIADGCSFVVSTLYGVIP